MTDLRLPCREGNPDDWFIGKDGRQYPDDDLLSDEIRQAILEEATRQGLTGEARVTFIEKAEDRAEGDAKREALRRRRHAKEACMTCPLRLQCLDLALRSELQPHGTWGGYYEEEIREIRREITRRRKNSRELPLLDD